MESRQIGHFLHFSEQVLQYMEIKHKTKAILTKKKIDK